MMLIARWDFLDRKYLRAMKKGSCIVDDLFGKGTESSDRLFPGFHDQSGAGRMLHGNVQPVEQISDWIRYRIIDRNDKEEEF